MLNGGFEALLNTHLLEEKQGFQKWILDVAFHGTSFSSLQETSGF